LFLQTVQQKEECKYSCEYDGGAQREKPEEGQARCVKKFFSTYVYVINSKYQWRKVFSSRQTYVSYTDYWCDYFLLRFTQFLVILKSL